jgi:hypothetical protein
MKNQINNNYSSCFCFLQQEFLLSKPQGSQKISFQMIKDSLLFQKKEKVADLFYDPSENVAVIRAAKDLQTDIQKVTEKLPNLTTETSAHEFEIIIGTV